MAELVKGGKGRGKRNSKQRNSLNSVGAESGANILEEEQRAEDMLVGVDGSINVMPSPPSGMRVILEEEGTQVLENPIPAQGEDPLKKLEAESLFGIQNELGFSFTTPRLADTERLEVMEVVDVKNKVIWERRVVDQ